MAAGVIAAAAAAAQKKANDTADAAWAPYAKSKGYTLRRSQAGAAHVDPARVSGKEDGVSIAFEVAPFEGDWGMTLVAVPPAPVPVRLELAPEGMFQKLTKLFGAQDIQIGDAPFDTAYMIKGSDAPATRVVLCEATRKAMLSLGVATFVYDDGSTKERPAVIIAGIPSLFTTTDQLDRMIAFMVAVAKIQS